ncbi:hypothetical protein [Granulicoccus sp. GXG6511]|uniref:hypothetical protein n=1 Tax=Granulicoccus sp. GXG6511 TaxID=3381351 RepID=UPI003D7C67AD
MTTKNLGLDHEPAGPTHDQRGHRAAIGWWPSALGLVAGLLGGGGNVSATIASVIAVLALIYVATAVIGRQVAAWWGFLLSVPVVLSGRLTGISAAPFVLIGILAMALLLIGWPRGTWAQACNRAQLYGLIAFGAISVAGALTDGVLAAALVAGGLIAHAFWDVIHLIGNAVVGRRYAEFCAIFDAVLGVAILWGLF